MKPGVDSADLYFQHAVTETWSLEDSMIKSGAHHIEHGVGVRAVAGDKQGLAYSDDLRMPALGDAAHTAGAIVRQGQERSEARRVGKECVRTCTSRWAQDTQKK